MGLRQVAGRTISDVAKASFTMSMVMYMTESGELMCGMAWDHTPMQTLGASTLECGRTDYGMVTVN